MMLENLICAHCILSSRSSMKWGSAFHIPSPSFLVVPGWVITPYVLLVTEVFSLHFHLMNISAVHVLFFAVTLPTPGKYNCFPCFLLREYKSGGNCWRWCCCLTPALHHSKWEQMELSKALTPGAEHSVLASTNSPRSGSGSSWWCYLMRLLSCAFCTQQRHKS